MQQDLLQWHIAAKETLATLHLMRERLEVSNYQGDEEPFMQDCDNAIAMLTALPINEEAVREHQRVSEPPKFSHMYDFAFVVISSDPEGKDVTPVMLIEACRARLSSIESEDRGAEMLQACGLCDSYELDIK